MIKLRSVLLRMRNVLGKSCRENKNTILCSITSPAPPPSPEYSILYEITWKNMVEPDRLQMTIWRTRITRWTTKATNTQSEYVTFTFKGNNGYANASQCYVIRILPVMLSSPPVPDLLWGPLSQRRSVSEVRRPGRQIKYLNST